jgi:hypothetical protein
LILVASIVLVLALALICIALGRRRSSSETSVLAGPDWRADIPDGWEVPRRIRGDH